VVEATGGFFGNGGAGTIEDGKVDGDNITFRAGDTTYSGTLNGDQIELRKSLPRFLGGRGTSPKSIDAAPRPIIGPPPDGSDPSFPAMDFSRMELPPLVLRRAIR
jgi:beta-galactosidase